MQIIPFTFRSIEELEAGPKWAAVFEERWPHYHAWFLSEGLLDGMNDAGLAVSLTFGGRRTLGDGFGIPIVLRYLLETCETVGQARTVLARLPYALAHNLTLVDRGGGVLTAYLSPDREPIYRAFPVATNHQGIVVWPEQARATRTVERGAHLLAMLEDPASTADAFVDGFLREPLYSTAYSSGFRHPVYGRLPAGRGGRDVPLAGLRVDAFVRRVRGGPPHGDPRGGLHRLKFRGDELCPGSRRWKTPDVTGEGV